jgi:hypothetical protein
MNAEFLIRVSAALDLLNGSDRRANNRVMLKNSAGQGWVAGELLD